MSTDPYTSLNNAFELCSQTDNMKVKAGEKELKMLALDRNYPLYLLEYIIKNDQPAAVQFRMRAAIEFKRWVNDDWTKPNIQDIEFSEVHRNIKANIVRAWVSLPKVEERLLRESILIIAKWEFPLRWETMTEEMMGFLVQNPINSLVNFRIFKLLSKLIARYEYTTRSDNLYREIIIVADTTADYLLHFAKEILTILSNPPANADAVQELLVLLKQVIKCFYFLNVQDMPAKFEDNLGTWMQILSAVLKLDIMQFGADIKMHVFKCKGESLRSILLYITKYKEDVESLVQSFSQQVYEVCMKITDEDSSNKFILNAMKYFKNLLYWSELRSFFADSMESLLHTLVFRMEKPTKDDDDVFETEPDGFIENVLNNAGGSTRKNTVHELAKALAKSYTDQVVPILQNLIGTYIQLFQNGQTDQVNEITIINILIDMTVSKFTPRMGVTELILPAEFVTFLFSSVVEPNLTKLFEFAQTQNANIDSLNLFHVSHLIRYVFFFRNYLDKGKLLEIIKGISFLAKTKHETFKRVVYHCIEGLIAIRDSMDIFAPSNFFYNKNNAYPHIQNVLQNVYEDIKASKEITPYIVKALYNIIKIMDDSAATFTDAFCDLFKDMIVKINKSYDFNSIYLVFDSLATFIAHTKDNETAMNFVSKDIFPQLNSIIESNHPDLLSYAFQIYALCIHVYKLPTDNTALLFNSLMKLNNWDKSNASMFPAYLMFIEELVVKNNDLLWSNLDSIKNIMSIVLIDNQQDQLFFNLANKIVLEIDLKLLRDSQLLGSMLQIILRAIFESQNEIANKENNKPSVVRGSLGKNVLLFWSLCIVKFTIDEFLQDVQAAFGENFNVFYTFLVQENLIIKQYQRQPERKVLLNGMESIIFSSFYDKLPQELWQTLLNSVVENIFRRRRHKLASDIGDPYSKNITTGHSSNFQKLSWFSTQKLPYSELPDEDTRFVTEFKTKFGGMAQQILEQAIDPKLQKFFQELFQG